MWTLVLLLIAALSIIPLGFKIDFLKVELPGISRWSAARVALISLFLPATAEEIFFRVLLIPHAAEQSSLIYQSLAIAISLILFVAYHPLNAKFLMRSARGTFDTLPFLIFATILGLVCTAAYLESGSIYPPIFLHWIIVIIWLLCFGGYRRLYAKAGER